MRAEHTSPKRKRVHFCDFTAVIPIDTVEANIREANIWEANIRLARVVSRARSTPCTDLEKQKCARSARRPIGKVSDSPGGDGAQKAVA